MSELRIKGARVHNLKNIDITIPRDQFVVLTGLFGGLFGHKILKILKVKSDIAIGLALGSASHVIGTSACVEKKKYKQVASSTIGLILVGVLTVIIALALKKYIVV